MLHRDKLSPSRCLITIRGIIRRPCLALQLKQASHAEPHLRLIIATIAARAARLLKQHARAQVHTRHALQRQHRHMAHRRLWRVTDARGAGEGEQAPHSMTAATIITAAARTARLKLLGRCHTLTKRLCQRREAVCESLGETRCGLGHKGWQQATLLKQNIHIDEHRRCRCRGGCGGRCPVKRLLG